MVNKKINHALSQHIDRVNSGKNYIHKKRIQHRERCRLFLTKCREYFLPQSNFENTDLNSEELTNKEVIIVKREDKGFFKHFSQFCKYLKKILFFWRVEGNKDSKIKSKDSTN